MAKRRKIEFDPVNGPFGFISGGSSAARVCIAAVTPVVEESRMRARLWQDVEEMSPDAVRKAADHSGNPSEARARVFIALLCAAGFAPSIRDMAQLTSGKHKWPEDAILDAEGFWWGHLSHGKLHKLNRRGAIYRFGSDSAPPGRKPSEITPSRRFKAKLSHQAKSSKTSVSLRDSVSVLTDDEEYLVQWLLLDPEERKADELPETLEGVAEFLRVDSSTLRKWKQRPHIVDEMQRRLDEWRTSPEVVMQLEKSMMRQAMDEGDPVAAQKLLDHLLKISAVGRVEKQQGTDELVDSLSESEFAELKARLEGE